MQPLYCATLLWIACQDSVEGILELNREHHMSLNLRVLLVQTPQESLIHQHSNPVQLVLRVLLVHGIRTVRLTIFFALQSVLRKSRCLRNSPKIRGMLQPTLRG